VNKIRRGLLPRVKTGTKRRRRHKKILKATKGYYGSRGKLIKRSMEAYLRAGEHAFAGRKLRKRDLRRLWIQRINAALTPFDLKYSRFIKLLKDKKIELDRKILSDITISDPDTFEEIVSKLK